MPRFVVDEVGLPLWKPVAPAGAINVGSIGGLQSLKRGRPMEPQMPSGSCAWKCSAKTKSDVSVPLSEPCHCSKDGPTPSCEDENFDSCIGFGGTAPHDEFGDFDLGPPPPSGPVLVRQNAMDFTASSEAKYAAASRKFEPTSMAIAGLMSTRGPALMMATPMLLRHNRPMGLK